MPFFALSLSLSTKSSLPFGFAALFLSASCLSGSLLGKLSYRLHKSTHDGFCCYMNVGSDAATIATVV